MVTTARLALDGGPKSVAVPPGDRLTVLWGQEIEAVTQTTRSTDLSAPTASFEQEFAAFAQTRHALALGIGTAALGTLASLLATRR